MNSLQEHFKDGADQIVMGNENSLNDVEDWWSCGKHTKEGNLLFIYLIKPISAIVAIATADSEAKLDKDYRWVANIKDVKIINPPMTLAKIQNDFRSWAWARHPRRPTYIAKNIAAKLLKLISDARNASPEKIVSSAGAGFGNPEQNRLVEKAACKAVRLYFRKKGYKVISREKENLGYDFDMTSREEEFHVEVKGISGSISNFMITANEVKRAETDSQFQLAAVTKALSAPKIHVFTGKEFLKKFTLNPSAYFAGVKQNLSA